MIRPWHILDSLVHGPQTLFPFPLEKEEREHKLYVL